MLWMTFGNSETMMKNISSMEQTVLIKGKIKVGEENFPVVYYDNPTSRSLVAQMPFTVTLEDYAGIEKIFYPPQSLNKDDAPEGAEPQIGDLMYYAPWGDVAIFYKNFRFASGLIPLGKVEHLEILMSAVKANAFRATFETE